jgi:hypothetical protein
MSNEASELKSLISAMASKEAYDIFLDIEGLEELGDVQCAMLITRLQTRIDAYQRLRRARTELAQADACMEAAVRPLDIDGIPF